VVILFAGTGSIGSRHIRNLKKAEEEFGINIEIHAIKHSDGFIYDDIEPLITKVFTDVSQLPEEKYDAVFITNPTNKHTETIKNLSPHAKNLFIEKPIAATPEDAETSPSLVTASPSLVIPAKAGISNQHHSKAEPRQLQTNKTTTGVTYVAAPMRHTELYKALKQHVEKNPPIGARIICSSYMPNWQPGRNYKESFRVSESSGGGVDIDLIHELDYMTALFGQPEKVQRAAGHYSALEMDACDVAAYIFTYPHMLCEVHLDFYGAKDKRTAEIYTNEDTITADFLARTLTHEKFSEEVRFSLKKDHYYEEIKYFLKLITGEETNNINTVENAIQTLKLAKGIL
jgi:predicted dehydrogenase